MCYISLHCTYLLTSFGT